MKTTALMVCLVLGITCSEALAATAGDAVAGASTTGAAVVHQPAVLQLLGSPIVRWILTTSFLFGVIAALSHPGHGIAEAIAVTSLSVLVGVPLLAGSAQWWEIAAIILGVLMLALEIFVFPGFGIAGVSGILLLILGLTMIGVPGILADRTAMWSMVRQSLLIVVSGMACSLLLWVWLQHYLPKLPYLNRLILTTTSGAGSSLTADLPSTATPCVAVGAVGKAATDLRPGGTVAFGGPTGGDIQVVDVVSDCGFVDAGAEVVVREVHGNRVVVRGKEMTA
jgi:membrane-bound serine protease (ClpP class)